MDFISNIKVSFFNAGLISIWDQGWALHLIVFPSYWMFGKSGSKQVKMYGGGPVFLFCLNK